MINNITLDVLFYRMQKIQCLLVVCALTLSNCTMVQEEEKQRYDIKSLTQDWHANEKKKPILYYEKYGIPSDNDSEYQLPKGMQKKEKKVSVPTLAVPGNNNDSSTSWSFPRYNPAADNIYMDPKLYPLYMNQ